MHAPWINLEDILLSEMSQSQTDKSSINVRSPERQIGEGNGTPLQYSCLENPMDGRAWGAAVHGVARSRTQLSDFTFPFSLSCIGEGNNNPLQCSCLENPRDGRALMGCRLWGRIESDRTEATQQQQQQQQQSVRFREGG